MLCRDVCVPQPRCKDHGSSQRSLQSPPRLWAQFRLHPNTDGWHFTSEELWAMNQLSIYPHVFGVRIVFALNRMSALKI